MNETTTLIHRLLPYHAQETLKKAAQECRTLEGLERVRVIEKAIERVKRQYPEFFRDTKG